MMVETGWNATPAEWRGQLQSILICCTLTMIRLHLSNKLLSNTFAYEKDVDPSTDCQRQPRHQRRQLCWFPIVVTHIKFGIIQWNIIRTWSGMRKGINWIASKRRQCWNWLQESHERRPVGVVDADRSGTSNGAIENGTWEVRFYHQWVSLFLALDENKVLTMRCDESYERCSRHWCWNGSRGLGFDTLEHTVQLNYTLEARHVLKSNGSS